MATWNGPWLKDCVLLWSIVHQCRFNLDDIPGKAQEIHEVVDLFTVFWNHVLVWASRNENWKHYSAVLEVSTNSEEHRVHLHLMVSFHERARIINFARCTFSGMRPGDVTAANGRGARAANRALREGHYYCQCMKVGALMCKTNWVANVDFLVDAVMVKRLWRKRKLTAAMAIRELINCRDRSHTNVAEVEKACALEYRMLCQQLQVEAEEGWRPRPWKPASTTEIAWLLQYGHLFNQDVFDKSLAVQALRDEHGGNLPPQAGLQRRYYFLIYDGMSHTGKSERAIAWWGWNLTRVCNCHKVTSPNLRNWLNGKEKAIVFEECDWRLVAENKLLFQATTRPVTLSQSQCNESAYDVWVHGTPMICTSNDFWRDCNDDEIADWIKMNSYYVWVDSPLWLAAEAQGLLLPFVHRDFA